jgi:hypothetical protein
VLLHSLLTSPLDGYECLASRPRLFAAGGEPSVLVVPRGQSGRFGEEKTFLLMPSK